jgi:hypothetical protein
MLTLKPAVKKTCASQALYDMGTSPGSLPDKLTIKVFNHHKNGTFIQTEDPRRHPGV